MPNRSSVKRSATKAPKPSLEALVTAPEILALAGNRRCKRLRPVTNWPTAKAIPATAMKAAETQATSKMSISST
jgi:hypothetical protein